MNVSVLVTKYEDDEDYFTFHIDRSVSYDFSTSELKEILYWFLDTSLLNFYNEKVEAEREGADAEDIESARKVFENAKTAMEFLIDYKYLVPPSKTSTRFIKQS